MLNKNDECVIEITGMGSDGEGVGKTDGYKVFVPFALLGEKVRVKILKPLKNYAYGKIEEIISFSPYRIDPKCSYFYKCGGCNFCHANYKFELEYKQNLVKDALKRIGGIDTEVLPIIGSQRVENYRNKAQFPVTNDGIGFYANRSHRLIPINNCQIQHEVNAEIISIVKEYMSMFNVPPYDEKNHKGDIRHIYTRTASNTGEIMVCIVTRTEKLLNSGELVERLLKTDNNIVSIIQNVNSDKTNVALGKKEILLWGKPYITDKIGDLIFEISPNSFYQVNSFQTKKLYDKVIDLANLTGNERVFDLYCGIGTITLYAARYANEIIGVENIQAAVDNAIKNAKLNNITNAVFYKGEAEKIALNLGNADVIIVDPPRKGCDKKLLSAINDINPQRVVYVSCNPATLARDLKILYEYGFEISCVQPVDMFPRTAHVETVVLMSRIEK